MRTASRMMLAAATIVAAFVGDQEVAFSQAAAGLQDSTGISAGATSPGGAAVNLVSLDRPTSAGGTPVGGGSSGGSSAPSPYTYQRKYLAGPCESIAGEPPGRVYSDMRTDTSGGETVEVAGGCERPSAPAPATPAGGGSAPAPSPGALATQAIQRTPLPAPQMSMSPGGSIPLLVNLPTFLWIDPAQWRPQTASASAGGVTSTVTATPERVVWDMGQGDSVTCDGPGVAYVPNLADDAQPSTCRFTYPASSARTDDKSFTVRATIEYHVTWTASGAAGGGDLGISRRSSTTTVRVAELQALNVAGSRS